MPSTEMTKTLRQALQQERQSVAASLEDRGPETDDIAFDDNDADSAEVSVEQSESKTLVNAMTEQLAEIDRALEKLEAGTYGTCEVCERPIAEERLEAVPATRYCIDHAAGQ